MAHVLLAATPFAGHVLPLLGLARELRRRHHRVSFYTGVKYRVLVEAEGAAWVGFERATDFDDVNPEASFPAMKPGVGLPAMVDSFRYLFFGTAPGQAEDILSLHERDPVDAIVAEGTCVGPSLAHELARIPFATMAQAPMALGLHPLLRMLMDRTLNVTFTRMHNRTRAQVGLPPTRHPGLEGTWSRDLVTAQGTESLERPRRPPEAHVRFIGDAAAGTRTTGTSPRWIERLPTGTPVVHVSQGTLDRDDFPLLTRTIAALARSPVHVVASGRIPSSGLPVNVTAADWVPQDLVFPRTSVFVSNGGYGGVLAALGHGVPVLVVPGAQDKPLVAANVQRSGAGVRLRRGRATTERLRRTVESMVTDEHLRRRARGVADDLVGAGGGGRAADLVEAELL